MRAVHTGPPDRDIGVVPLSAREESELAATGDLAGAWHNARPVPGPAYRQSVLAAVRDPNRVAIVRRLEPLYSPPSMTFDRLTALTAYLLEAPLALLTLVDRDRQFFVSSFGLDETTRTARETPLDYSICQHAVAAGLPLVVAEASKDPRLTGNLAVTDLGVASYAGIPLMVDNRWAAGTLCVIDFVPRDWTSDKLAHLATLADICRDEIRLAGLDRHAALF
jgi:GAF domain-containing protein